MIITHPEFNPVALAIGPLKIHWYGLMYLVGFLAGWWLGRLRAKKPGAIVNVQQMDDLVIYVALGVILGGRIGYVLFYQFAAFMQDPLLLFKIWQGGMSFHGGLIGVITVMLWYSNSIKVTFFQLADFVAPLVPIGLGTGRIGNFINGELWGRPTNTDWGIIFPQIDTVARHPSQLYEAVLEGLVLFIILWWFSSKPRPTMAVSALFLIFYGLFRSLVEFFREPDDHLGFIAFEWLTMGQLLSLPMIILGFILLVIAYRKKA